MLSWLCPRCHFPQQAVKPEKSLKTYSAVDLMKGKSELQNK